MLSFQDPWENVASALSLLGWAFPPHGAALMAALDFLARVLFLVNTRTQLPEEARRWWGGRPVPRRKSIMLAVNQRAFHQRMQRWAAHWSLIEARSIFKGNTDLAAAGRRWPTVTCLMVWAGSNPRASEENGALASALCGDLSPQASCRKETFQLSVSKPFSFLGKHAAAPVCAVQREDACVFWRWIYIKTSSASPFY